MSGLIASAAIGAVGAGYKIANGISQNSAANKLRAGLVRPTYDIQKEYYQNQGLAANAAQSGLSSSSKDFYSDQADRGLSAGINGILQGGGDVNSIGGLYDKYNQGNRSITSEDSRLRSDNLRYLMDQNSTLAAEENKAWAINKYEPYKDTAQAITAQKNAAQQNISSGIGELGSVASNVYSAKYAEDNAPRVPTPENNIENTGRFSGVPSISTSSTMSNPFGSLIPPVNNGAPINGIYGTAAKNTLTKNYYNSPFYGQLMSYLDNVS